MRFRLMPERAQPLAQFGAARFQVVILLAKASPRRRRGFQFGCRFGTAAGHEIYRLNALFAAKARMPAIGAKQKGRKYQWPPRLRLPDN
jgi:hypothetical protein